MDKLSIYEPPDSSDEPRETCFLDLMRRQYLMFISCASGPETKRLVGDLTFLLDDFLRFVATIVDDPEAYVVLDETRVKLLSDTFAEDHPRPDKPA